uniref:Uncharacterized protein n=1 Tax=Rhizophora mucronata TaxID=61149 RepID=A0A2P2QIH2_RHIMU
MKEISFAGNWEIRTQFRNSFNQAKLSRPRMAFYANYFLQPHGC